MEAGIAAGGVVVAHGLLCAVSGFVAEWWVSCRRQKMTEVSTMVIYSMILTIAC